MQDFDENADVVIVGSGGGAMCAALFLASKGRKVIILEKTPFVGGSTARSGGVMWIPNNPFLKRDGIEDSLEKAMTYLDGLVADFDDSPGSTAVRRKTYLKESVNMLEFLLAEGIKIDRVGYWPDYYDERPGGLEEGRSVAADFFDVNELGDWKQKMRPGFLEMPMTLLEAMQVQDFRRSWAARKLLCRIAGRIIRAFLTGKHYVSAGSALQGRMLQALLRRGVDIRVDSPVTELIEDDGRIKGVLTIKDGRRWRVAGRCGVLVGAGGFAHNQRMRDKYQPGTSAAWSSAVPSDTGEMIEEMMRHGAAIAQMEEMVGYQCIPVPESKEGEIQQPAQSVTAKPHAILVDQSGVRYLNEGGSYVAYCQGMLKRNKTVPAVPSWAIFDSQYLKKYMLAGTMPGTRKPRSWYEQGYLRKADSIEALARLIEVDPVILKATIERFNGFVEKNFDADFHRGERAYDRWLGDALHKPSPTLGAIDKAPYYAMAVYPGDVGTYGGVLTDEHARVLREDGSVISGLYATGVSTASVMGRVYPGAGASIGPTFTWGYVAAKHALST